MLLSAKRRTGEQSTPLWLSSQLSGMPPQSLSFMQESPIRGPPVTTVQEPTSGPFWMSGQVSQMSPAPSWSRSPLVPSSVSTGSLAVQFWMQFRG